MDLTHQLRLPVPPDQAWAAVNDPSRLAPVVPGASLDTVTDDAFTGMLKIKLGPLALAFDGSGRYTARDAGTSRVVVTTRGEDRRGHGGVEATHTVTLAAAADGASTDVTVRTTLSVTGRPAQLGRGVVSDAVDKTMGQLGGRVGSRVSEGLPGFPEPTGVTAATGGARAAGDVVDHPVELGATFGDVDEASLTGPAPSRRPAPSPRARPEPPPYVYRPDSNTAEPHVVGVRTVSRLLVTRVAPYAGLGALAAYGVVRLARRGARR